MEESNDKKNTSKNEEEQAHVYRIRKHANMMWLTTGICYCKSMNNELQIKNNGPNKTIELHSKTLEADYCTVNDKDPHNEEGKFGKWMVADIGGK